MPEGPSIYILRENVAQFIGRKVLAVEGNTPLDIQQLQGKTIKNIRSWGKHLLIEFPKITVRIHLMLFGSYRVNSRKKFEPRLSLQFTNGEELNFYTVQMVLIEEPLNKVYDWKVDIMGDKWSTNHVLKLLKEEHPKDKACDVLMNQSLFAGCGNIIKNEVLWQARIHPLSTIENIPARKLREMTNKCSKYSFDFLKWKRKKELSKHFEVYEQSHCPNGHKLTVKNTGKSHRRSYFCPKCQVEY
jgi:endonuclease-8